MARRRWKLWVWIAGLALSLGVIAFLGRGLDYNEHVVGLRSTSPGARYSAALALGDMGERAAPAIPNLIALLGDEETVIRRTRLAGEAASRDARYTIGSEAANALARIGMASVPALIESLKSENEEVRRNAYWALRAISGEAELGPSAEEWRRWQEKKGGAQ